MADLIKSSQVVTQVETDLAGTIKSSQVAAQTETDTPPIVRAYQVVVQVEYEPHTASGQFLEGFEGGHANAWDCSGMTSVLSYVKHEPSSGSASGTRTQPAATEQPWTYNRTNLDGDWNLYLDDGDYVRRPFVTTTDRIIYTSLWYRPAQLVASQWICGWYDAGGTLLAHLRVGTDGYLKLYRGASTEFTVATTINYALTVGERCKIYVSMQILPAGCTAQVWADGIHVMTDATASGYASEIQNTFQLGGTGAVKASFDNIVISDAAIRTDGNYYIVARKPNGAGSSTQWTPSSVPNYEQVNNIPFSSGAYHPNVHTNTVDYLDLYALENLQDDKTYFWAQIGAACEQEGTPTPAKIALAYRTGGVTTYGPDEAPDYGGLNTLFWTLTDDGTSSFLDDLEIGIKSRT